MISAIMIPAWLYFLGPLCVALLVILSCAVYYGFFRQVPSSTRLANIYRCEHCRHVYIDPRVVPLSKCPRCQKLNEAIIR